MILVDPHQWHAVSTGAAAAAAAAAAPPLTDGLGSTISSLDQEMKDILVNTKGDDYTKAQLYQQALHRYLKLADKYRQKPLGTVHVPTTHQVPKDELIVAPRDNNSVEMSTSRVVNSVPKHLRNKAELLMNYIKDIPNVSWDEKNQLIVENKVVEGTNVIDLANDLLRERKSVQPPKGWTILANALKTSNVPREVIGNPVRWHWIQQVDVSKKEEEDQQPQESRATPLSRRQRRRSHSLTPTPKIQQWETWR